jgi:hypothetical protein
MGASETSFGVGKSQLGAAGAVGSFVTEQKHWK